MSEVSKINISLGNFQGELERYEGGFDVEQLKGILTDIGSTPDYASVMDVNNSGEVEFEELVDIAEILPGGGEDPRLEEFEVQLLNLFIDKYGDKITDNLGDTDYIVFENSAKILSSLYKLDVSNPIDFIGRILDREGSNSYWAMTMPKAIDDMFSIGMNKDEVSFLVKEVFQSSPNNVSAARAFKEISSFIQEERLVEEVGGVENFSELLECIVKNSKRDLNSSLRGLVDSAKALNKYLTKNETVKMLKLVIAQPRSGKNNVLEKLPSFLGEFASLYPAENISDIMPKLKLITQSHFGDFCANFKNINEFCANHSLNIVDLINNPEKKDSKVILGINSARFKPEHFSEIVLNRLPGLRLETETLVKDRPIALMVYPEADWNGAFEGDSGIVEDLIKRGYKVVYHEVSKDTDFVQAFESLGETNEKASLVLVGGHGTQDQTSLGDVDPANQDLSLSENFSLGFEDFEQLLTANLTQYLEMDAEAFLISCSTGQGEASEKNMANFLSHMLGIDVYAPTVPGNLTEIGFDENNKPDKAYWNDGTNGYVATAEVWDSLDRQITDIPDPEMHARHSENTHIVKQTVDGDLFVNGVSHKDIKQRAVGDCWFLASLASVAYNNPELIQNIIQENKGGDPPYFVSLYDPYTLEPMEPIGVDADLYYYESSQAPVYADTRTDDENTELWVALIEKAYAQVKGGYSRIEGQFPNLALRMFTGEEYVGGGALLGLEKISKLNPVVVETGYSVIDGLMPKHAYTVLDFRERNGDTELLLYNPHGQNELGQDGDDDGEFWISWDVFQENFSGITYLKTEETTNLWKIWHNN